MFLLYITYQKVKSLYGGLFVNCLQISLLILSELKRINFYSSWKHQKNIGFFIILGGINVNLLEFSEY